MDEFTSSNSGQYENRQWIPALWEGLDFYAPNDYDSTSSRMITVPTTGLRAGVYFLRLTGGGHSQLRRFVITE